MDSEPRRVSSFSTFRVKIFVFNLGSQGAKDRRLKMSESVLHVDRTVSMCCLFIWGLNPDHENIIYSNVKRTNHDDDGTEYV